MPLDDAEFADKPPVKEAVIGDEAAPSHSIIIHNEMTSQRQKEEPQIVGDNFEASDSKRVAVVLQDNVDDNCGDDDDDVDDAGASFSL